MMSMQQGCRLAKMSARQMGKGSGTNRNVFDSRQLKEIVEASVIKNGTVAVVSHHTTCSVTVQECSHDIDSFDLEYLQHDLLDIMRKMIPDCTNEGDFSSMNTDGHLHSVFFGRSETLTLKDGEIDGGSFAHIYFIDWYHITP